MKKIFTGKQFDEVEEDEDYKRLLVASPLSTTGKGESKKEVSEELTPQEEPMEPSAQTGAVEELVGLIVGGEAAPPAEEITVSATSVAEELQEEAKVPTPCEDEGNAISVTGVSAFKIEGKSVGPQAAPAPAGEKKQSTSKKATKENKGKAGAVAAPPANLSIMVLGILVVCVGEQDIGVEEGWGLSFQGEEQDVTKRLMYELKIT